jgi:hypothetical protein
MKTSYALLTEQDLSAIQTGIDASLLLSVSTGESLATTGK